MKKRIVSGVLVTTLLIPASYLYAKTQESNRPLPDSLQSLPSEVRKGSISVDENVENSQSKLAKIDITKAIQLAKTANSGQILEAALAHENGYLVWDIKEVGANGETIDLKIDAGTGNLLAANFDDNEERSDSVEKRSLWKFWEDDDEDENRLSTKHDIRD